ncbi:S41 family peptidase [Alteribacter natronophilus]|uniref:S41 family peptidase n=1 Tax=Alteribacter natronophilus TaxID=2583810 RepID=UPI00110D4CED|nr:S41 family peptidase [Alteribacter natronophilus]TMW72401.1 PDZ domain-containing protein [Alteribacter natronophilus]
MNVEKKLLPIIVAVSVLLGAAGMFITLQVTGGETAEPVMQEPAQPETGSDAVGEDAGEEEPSAAVETSGKLSEDKMEKFQRAYATIMEAYVEAPDEDELLEGAISGMLETLDDPYSVYMDEESAREFMESLDPSFEGIGAEVNMINGQVTIVSPIRDSPAEDAGLRPNDMILEVDGESIEGLTLNEAVLKIRGEKGSTVTLTIERPGMSDEFQIDVIRDEITVETVTSERYEAGDKQIGYLEIRSFAQDTANRFKEELDELEEQGIDGLVIDVRGNPGGLLQSVEEIGNLLIPKDEPIVQRQDRNGDILRHLSTQEGEKEYPIVTLIDEGSASASEILAAALKESGGHEVVGETTFGKGTVQQTFDLGDESELKLTVFKWLTAGGNDINEVGVDPTEEVRQPEYFYLSPVQAEEPLEFDENSEQVRNAQLMLEGLGYDPGRTDGYFSRDTEEAVEQFQADVELDVTGVIDEDTALALRDEIVDMVRDPENDRQLNRALELFEQ